VMRGMSRRAGAIAAVVTAVGVLVASGCGSDDDDGDASAGGQAAKQFVPERQGGIPGALLPEERELWKYNFDSGKFEVVEGDASKPYEPDIEKFEPGTKIAYIDPWSSDPFAISIREHFEKLADEYGFEVVYCDTEFKAEKAVECAEQVASQDPDFVHAGNWQAGSAAAMMRVLDEARLPANSNDVAHPNGIFVGADNYTAGLIGGKAAGEFAKAEWNCEDVWVLLGEAPPEGEAADLRLQGFGDGVQEVCGALPDDQITRVRADSTAEQALTATTDWLTAHPQAERVVSVSLGAGRSIGMAKAFERSDRDAYAVGMTCDGAEIEVVYQAPPSENHFLGCVAFFPEKYPPLIVSTAQDVLEGKPVPNEVHVEHEFLDHENIGEYYPEPK
jgi:ribose transport system substrate-binding protein